MRFYLTTPIYYVNATPHIGHAYTTIAADIIVRHHRQRGDETFFLTGVDEHATKVFRVAEAEGLEPQEYVDRIAEVWRELPGRVGAEPDFFIRTSDEGHKRFVRDFLQRIYDNGDVYEGVYAGLYCVGCEAFKAESDLVDGKCPDHGDVEYIEEKNYFFRLSAYEDRLLALYEERPDFVLPRFRANEARSFIEQGLQDFSISRAGQPWGIPLPWDEDQVAYVWADALVNYLSALTLRAPGTDLVPEFWPAARHVMAKDILRFHCVYWPAMLMSAGYDVPAADLRPRLPADGRHEDLEVPRQRDRPAAARRRLRRRRGALLGDPLGVVRPGRHGVDRLAPRALRARARQRSRQSALADDGDDRAVPGRRP